MPEISTRYPVLQAQAPASRQQALRRAPRELTIEDVYKREKRRNHGLIERLYNSIKNVTGLGVGTKKLDRTLQKVQAGEIKQEDALKQLKAYSASQENSAQILGDAASMGAAGFTFFKLNREFKMLNSKALLNQKFEEVLKEGTKGGNKPKGAGSVLLKLAETVKSKNKLIAIAALFSAFAGGYAKILTLLINRIGSKEFKSDKKDFNGAKNNYDKALYKRDKKAKRAAHFKSDLRNFASGAINGLLMPLATLGGAVIGVPLYFAANSINRYFVGSKEDKNKSFGGYINNLKNDSVTNLAFAAATAVPMVKKVGFAKVFDTNLKKATDKLLNASLKDSEFKGESTYKELESILMKSENVSKIMENKTIKMEDKVKKLTEENIFAVKFKQISNDSSALTRMLRENCPETRTIEQAQKMIDEKLGSGYTISKLLGVGTVAETYLAKSPDGKDVCLKVLKDGINKEKILKDKEKFVELIKNMAHKTADEKDYLLRNIDDLAGGILKEVDFVNEMNAAKKLVEYTKKANLVKPIEVKNGVYVMEKAEGISLNSLVKLNRYNLVLGELEKRMNKYPGRAFLLQEHVQEIKSKIAKIQARTPEYGDIKLTDSDASYLLDEYMKVLVEQFNKVDKKGKVIHADIHPGNIFIDVNALKSRKGKVFTLIDTGNTIEQTMEQSIRSLSLTSYIKKGNVPDIVEFVLEGAVLPKGMTKEEASKKIAEELKKCFFDTETRLETVNNNSLLTLTSNIMRKYNIIPSDSQLNRNKANKSAYNSFIELVEVLFTNKFKDLDIDKAGTMERTSVALQAVYTGASKLMKFKKLKSKQEKLNLLQMSLEQQLKYKKNPNNLKTNSEDYLTYKLKQSIASK